MVNVRKGSAHSLSQTDFVGTADPDTNIVAGQLVYLNGSTGEIELVAKLNNSTRGSATNKITNSELIGFAITTQAEGDAIESGKIGVYALDGGSVIETDKFSGTYSASDIGSAVVQDANGGADGNVTVVSPGTAERIIGVVYAAPRVIYVGQTAVTVLPIKLSA